MKTKTLIAHLIIGSIAMAHAVAQDTLPIIREYNGRIHTESTYYLDEQRAPLPKEIVITNQIQYAQFVRRLPATEPLNTKGDDHVNDDPLLKLPPVDFATQLVVAVMRDNMYLPADITEIRVTNETVVVDYTEEELGEVAYYQEEGGLGTYCAAVIPRTTMPLHFSGTKIPARTYRSQ